MIKSILVELTHGCSLCTCLFCSSRALPFKAGKYIPLLLFKDIIRRLVDQGLREIEVSGGEPLLMRNHIEELLLLAREHNLKIKIFTNGVVRELPHYIYLFSRFRDYVEVHFPVYGDKILHELMVRIDRHFEYLMMVTKYLSELGVFVGFNMVLTRQACSYYIIEKVLDYAETYGAKMVSILRYVAHGRGYDNRHLLEPTVLDYARFYKILQKLDKDYRWDVTLRLGCPIAPRRLSLRSSIIKVSRKCVCAEEHFCILPDLTVCPCVAFKWNRKWRFSLDVFFGRTPRVEKFISEKKARTNCYYCFAQFQLYKGIDLAKLGEEIALKEL